MAKRKSLGRGLEALLSTPAATAPEPVAEDALKEIPVDLLQRGQYQPRVDMREEALKELAESIRVQGVVQPIVVRPLSGAGPETRYEIVAGERRWRAAQMAGLDRVPAVVKEMKSAYGKFWQEARPLMVNEQAPLPKTRPYHEAYRAQQEDGGHRQGG